MTPKEAQLQAVNSQLATARYQLGDHFALLVLEALEVWVNLAGNLAHSSRPAAKQQVERYVAVLERMRAVAAGITVVGLVPEVKDGRADRADGG